MSEIKLTDEQQAVVNHNHGPARVFAVAGAGKTTAMVHRIHRLVAEEIFAPHRILASSFSRETVVSLEQALSHWSGCRAVQTRTLHSLGNAVIKKAQQYGYLDLPQFPIEADRVESQLLTLTVRAARMQNLPFKDELENLDQEDFLAYINRCKGKLHYADLDQVTFAAEAPHRNIAQAAEPPSKELSWYLDLYRIFEIIRHREGWISFDDMLMTGWQLLVQYPNLRQELQQQFDCIIIDEFQDVNRAQFAMLDLLVRPHRNYMVVGDDDQTIYEWRGAEARFMLEAFERYQPVNYQITDNFRCKASQVALANAVIRHNRKRYAKHLNLTQGFDGCTQIHSQPSVDLLGQAVVHQVEAALARGIAPDQIAILVRVYAQTPVIEQALIQAQIPYWGAKLVPFYRRPEILNFLAFAHLAQLEVSRSARSDISDQWVEEWNVLWNRVRLVPPLRYLNATLKEQIQQAVTTGQATLREMLDLLISEPIQERMSRNINLLTKWLEVSLQQRSAKAVLEQLDACIRYRDYLRQYSGFKETGQGKAAGVDAIIDYAAGKGNLLELLAHLDQLQQQAEQQTQNPNQCIRLTTIHQSKGLEWPVVIVPHCNDGIIPFGEDFSEADLEEERRLLYVAITRSKQDLHLYLLQKQPMSRFLQEARAEAVLKRTQRLQQLLATDPTTWQARDVVDLVRAVKAAGLERYFQQGWTLEPGQKAAMATTIQRCFAAASQQGVADRLGLQDADLDLWKTIAPLQTPASDFPGLETLLKAAQPPVKPDRKPMRSEHTMLGKLQPNDRVEHKHFGQGVVVAIKVEKIDVEEIVTVNFRKYGSKRIQITREFCALRLVE